MVIHWNERTMLTGVHTLDLGLKEWIRCFNLFDAAVAEGRGAEHIHNLLAYMEEYTKAQLEMEELTTGAEDTPVNRTNREEHERFRRNVKEIRDWITRHGVTAVEVLSLKMEMEHWVQNHICKVDVMVWEEKRKKAEEQDLNSAAT